MRKIIYGDINLKKLHLTDLSECDLSDVDVTGDYHCSYNNLTSLKGAPQTVGGEFYCHSNHLTSLEGAPLYITSNFSCNSNPLTSLEGIPKTVGRDFYISKELKDKFPEECIRSMCKIAGKVRYI